MKLENESHMRPTVTPLRRGLLLVNLGSPQAPTTAALKPYLKQFLTDKYVIDLPYVFRQLLVRLIIVPFRAHKSAKAYAQVWRQEGSPLVHFTREFTGMVAQKLAKTYDVRFAMRYGSPSVAEVLKGWNVDGLDLVPLYPQYAESSTQTAIDEVKAEADRLGLKVRVLEDFFAEPEFITSEVSQIQAALTRLQPDHLLLSFHGLPEHHLNKLHPEVCHQTRSCCDQVTDLNRHCYRAQAFATARAIRQQLKFPSENVSVGFQSRLGRRPWIKPYTDLEIGRLIAEGKKRLLVSCPSFVADCLETLEEIQIRLRDQFIAEGGEALELIPALNADAIWVENFCSMISRVDLDWKSL